MLLPASVARREKKVCASTVENYSTVQRDSSRGGSAVAVFAHCFLLFLYNTKRLLSAKFTKFLFLYPVSISGIIVEKCKIGETLKILD